MFEMRRLSLFQCRVSSQLRVLEMRKTEEVKDAVDNILRDLVQETRSHPGRCINSLVNEE
jgi:hypothetical protein